MRKLAAAVVITLALTGCTKFTDTLGTVQQAAIDARMVFQPVVDNICSQFRKECTAEQTVMFTASELETKAACDAYKKCHQVRLHIINTFRMIEMLIADAEMSASIGDQESADMALGKALELVAQIRDQLRALGYLE